MDARSQRSNMASPASGRPCKCLFESCDCTYARCAQPGDPIPSSPSKSPSKSPPMGPPMSPPMSPRQLLFMDPEARQAFVNQFPAASSSHVSNWGDLSSLSPEFAVSGREDDVTGWGNVAPSSPGEDDLAGWDDLVLQSGLDNQNESAWNNIVNQNPILAQEAAPPRISPEYMQYSARMAAPGVPAPRDRPPPTPQGVSTVFLSPMPAEPAPASGRPCKCLFESCDCTYARCAQPGDPIPSSHRPQILPPPPTRPAPMEATARLYTGVTHLPVPSPQLTGHIQPTPAPSRQMDPQAARQFLQTRGYFPSSQTQKPSQPPPMLHVPRQMDPEVAKLIYRHHQAAPSSAPKAAGDQATPKHKPPSPQDVAASESVAPSSPADDDLAGWDDLVLQSGLDSQQDEAAWNDIVKQNPVIIEEAAPQRPTPEEMYNAARMAAPGVPAPRERPPDLPRGLSTVFMSPMPAKLDPTQGPYRAKPESPGRPALPAPEYLRPYSAPGEKTRPSPAGSGPPSTYVYKEVRGQLHPSGMPTDAPPPGYKKPPPLPFGEGRSHLRGEGKARMPLRSVIAPPPAAPPRIQVSQPEGFVETRRNLRSLRPPIRPPPGVELVPPQPYGEARRQQRPMEMALGELPSSASSKQGKSACSVCSSSVGTRRKESGCSVCPAPGPSNRMPRLQQFNEALGELPLSASFKHGKSACSVCPWWDDTGPFQIP